MLRRLTANVENLTYTGAAAFTGTGNTLANVITGGSGANTLNGLDGVDTLNGMGGNDILNGGTGADFMNGGLGNDTFVVDTVGDTTTEAASAGTDLVQASLTWTLATNVENLTLLGASAINGTGNTLNNVIIGNTVGNTLSGLAGNDTLDGNTGNDTLLGGDGNDTLNGGLGLDALAGGIGNDIFVFNTAPNATTNRDTITDYNVAADTIYLENSIFTTIVGTGVLTAAQFKIGAAATDADDRVIYNSATGALFYDSNGNAAGGSVQIATLTTGLALTNADFFVI